MYVTLEWTTCLHFNPEPEAALNFNSCRDKKAESVPACKTDTRMAGGTGKGQNPVQLPRVTTSCVGLPSP